MGLGRIASMTSTLRRRPLVIMVLLDNGVRLETRLIPVGKSQAAADLGRALRRTTSCQAACSDDAGELDVEPQLVVLG